MEPLGAMVLRATPEQHRRQIRALLDRPDALPHLGAIRCPTLVMVGRQTAGARSQNAGDRRRDPGRRTGRHRGQRPHGPGRTARAGYRRAARFLVCRDARRQHPGRAAVRPRLPRRGYRINKMAMGLSRPENRAAFLAGEEAYLDRFGLSAEEKRAVMARDWREMVRLGGNLFFILKISAVDPVRITEIGAHQAGMDHDTFLRERLGKR
jgi:protocatechuate 4,5-dioxygenase alpha subunit